MYANERCRMKMPACRLLCTVNSDVVFTICLLLFSISLCLLIYILCCCCCTGSLGYPGTINNELYSALSIQLSLHFRFFLHHFLLFLHLMHAMFRINNLLLSPTSHSHSNLSPPGNGIEIMRVVLRVGPGRDANHKNQIPEKMSTSHSFIQHKISWNQGIFSTIYWIWEISTKLASLGLTCKCLYRPKCLPIFALLI